MAKFLIILAIVLIILGIIGIFLVVFYNKIIVSKLKINDAEINIDEKLREKYDLIIRSINIIQKQIKIESKTFDDVKKIKSDKYSNFDIDRILNNALLEINSISEDYEKIYNNKSFKEISLDIEKIDERLTALRTYYNKHTLEYNGLIHSFPGNFLAKAKRFKQKKYYDGKNLDDLNIKDFKI